MSRPQVVVDADLAHRAHKDLHTIPSGLVSIRLRAIEASGDHPLKTVSAVFKVTPNTIRKWARRYRENGIEGLQDRPKGHNPAKLDEEKRATIERWLGDGVDARGEPTHWTLAKMVAAISEEFGLTVGKTPLWLTIRGLGFRPRVPRPMHAKADPDAQTDFKKNSEHRRRIAKGSRCHRFVSG